MNNTKIETQDNPNLSEALQSLRKSDPFIKENGFWDPDPDMEAVMPSTSELSQKEKDGWPFSLGSIKEQIQLIPEETLKNHLNIKQYGDRISTERKNNSFTLEEVADCLGVKRPIIERHEHGGIEGECKPNQRKIKRIDRSYLEAFSLLYSVAPLYLVGLTNDRSFYRGPNGKDGVPIKATRPFFEASPRVRNCIRFVLRQLYNNETGSKEINDRLLSDFLMAADAKRSLRKEIKQDVLSFMGIEGIDISFAPAKKELEWREFLYNNENYRSAISACFGMFERLGVLDYEFLNIMAQISCAEPKLKANICNCLESKFNLKSSKGFNKKVGLSKDSEGALIVSVQNELFFTDFGFGLDHDDSNLKGTRKDEKLSKQTVAARTAKAIYQHSVLDENFAKNVGRTTYISDSRLQINAWQNRVLKEAYPVVFMETIHYEVYKNHEPVTKTAYAAFAITPDGKKDILGVWFFEPETSKFYKNVLNDLKSRGVQDVYIFCTDSYGMAEVIKIVYPKSLVQRFFSRPVYSSAKCVAWEDIQPVLDDLKKVYAAATLDEAKGKLLYFSRMWKKKFTSCVSSREANSSILDPFFKYPPELREFLYTIGTAAVIICQLRQLTINNLCFDSKDALSKMVYLVSRNVVKQKRFEDQSWKRILNQLEAIRPNRTV